MRDKLNLRAFIILVICFAILLLGIYGLNLYQVSNYGSQILAAAEKSESAGNLDRALRFYYLYLEKNLNDYEIQEKYGSGMEKMGADKPYCRTEAIHAYEIVFERYPDRKDLQKKIALLYLKNREFVTASKHLEELRKSQPKDAEIPMYLGFCREQERLFPAAVKQYETSIILDPKLMGGYVRLVDVNLRELKNLPAASKAIDRMVAANPNELEVYLFRAKHRIDNKLPGVESDLKKSLDLAPDNPNVLLFSALYEKSQGQVEKAKNLLKDALTKKNIPEKAFIEYSLIQKQEKDGLNQAIATIKKGLETIPGNYSFFSALVQLYIDQKDIPSAVKTLEEMKRWKFRKHKMDILQAQVDIFEEKWQEARENLEVLRPVFMDDGSNQLVQIDYLLYLCYQKLGKSDLELAAIRRAANAAPNNARIQIALANVLVRMNRLSEALAIQKKFVQSEFTTDEAKLNYAKLLISERLARGSGSWQEGEDAVNEAAKNPGETLPISMLRVEILAGKKEFDKAVSLLTDLGKKNPNAVEIPVVISRIYYQQNKIAEAKAILEEAEKNIGLSNDLLVARLRYISTLEEAKSSGIIEKARKNLEKSNDKEKLLVTQVLAESFLRWSAAKEAEEYWIQFLELNPQDLALASRLLDVAFYLKADVLLQKLIAQIDNLDEPDGVVRNYAKAIGLIKKAQDGDMSALEEAKALLVKAGNKRRDWAAVVSAKGLIAEIEGKQEESLLHYTQAIDMGETRLLIVKKAILGLYQKQRSAQAEVIVKKLEKSGPLVGELRQVAAEVSLQNNDTQRALQLATATVSPDSKDPKELVWLAQVYILSNRLADAVGLLKKATELPGTSGLPWIALVRTYVRSGDTGKANDVIQDVAKKLKGAEINLTKAACYEAIGNPQAAENEYISAVTAGPEEYQTRHDLSDFFLRKGSDTKAIEQLREMRKLEAKYSKDEAAWVRRTLALTLATTNDIKLVNEGLDLIEENLKESNQSSLDILAKARLLASRSDMRSAALQLLEQLSKKQTLVPEQGFLLARLYVTNGKWREARKTMLDVLSKDSGNIEYLSFFVDQLAKNNEKSEAALWLARLEEIAPSNPNSVMLRCQSLIKQNNKKEALSTLKKFTESLKPSEDNNSKIVKLRTGAEIAEQLALLDATEGNQVLFQFAEDLLKKLVESTGSQDDGLELASYLGRRNRIEEALKVWNSYKDKGSRLTAGITGASIVSFKKVTPEQLKEVQEFLKESIDSTKGSESSRLRRLLADSSAINGNYSEAEGTLRELVKNNNEEGSINNLALMILIQGRNLQEALDLINKAIQKVGPTAGLRDTKALILLGQNKIEDALKESTKVIEEEPTPVRYYHLAQIYHKAGKSKESIDMIQKAIAGNVENNLYLPYEKSTFKNLLKELNLDESGKIKVNTSLNKD